MTPIVKVCNGLKCQITITDLTLDSDEYVSEDTLQIDLESYYSRNKYRYSDTYTINIILRNNSETDTQIIDTIFTCHDSYLDEEHYDVEKDGYYTIYHIILPSVEWYEKELEKKKSVLDSNTTIYVTDGELIYKRKENTLEVVEPELICIVNDTNTTISRVVLEEFCICHLYECYLSLCKQIYKNISYKCMNKDNIEDLIFKRDFIWMTINVLKYYVEFNLLFEAQRLLTEINYCGGICNEHSMLLSKKSGCGCSR